jgi:diguanylate cyclase (GGDEF)-like protein
MTALFAAVLFAVTALLTWRARSSFAELQSLLEKETKALHSIEQLQRNTAAFSLAFLAAAERDPARLEEIAGRSRSVTQLLEQIGERGAGQVTSATHELMAAARETAASWPEWQPQAQAAAIEQFERKSDQLLEQSRRLFITRQSEINHNLPLLQKRADGLMPVALGVVYIIALVSFVVARLTLARVVTPLEGLTRAAQRIAGGDYETRAPVAGDHEIAELGRQFNEMAAQLAASHRSLQHQARTDELTGLPNFRSFREAIDAQIERGLRYEETFGILVLDLDRFKSYNDEYGHAAGNEALQAVAAAIRTTVRSVDFPARYGGEEFAAVVPQIDASGLAAIAERVRLAVEAIPSIAGRRRLTVSIGGALFPDNGAAAADLFASADRRLYEAKEKGRNIVVIPPAGEPRVRLAR